MRYPIFLICCLILFGSCQPQAQNMPAPGIIPEPMKIIHAEGGLILHSQTPITINDPSLHFSAAQIQKWIGSPTIQEGSSGKILLKIDPSLDSLGREGYYLKSDREKLLIVAPAVEGIFYGVQTLRQMLPSEIENSKVADPTIPLTEIWDSPRFNWRGMHLDVSRHFFKTDFIKKYIDYLALHKINTFHWHLVDGIGWRMEIKSHPELTDWGAWRIQKEGNPWDYFEIAKPEDDRPKYGGFYTQEEVKEIIQYAAERAITVLPEIELPGHSKVVMKCFPELACLDKNGKHYPSTHVYCAGNPDSYQLLEDILAEVCEIFPSEYIHIGGDEVDKKYWKSCSKCQRLKQKEKLKNEHEIQSYFVNHFEKFLHNKGKKLIGWHEILEGQLSPTATIMYWKSDKESKEYIQKGHPIILTTENKYYFNFYQGDTPLEPVAWGGHTTLKDVYQYEPIPEGLNETELANVLGVQANLWTEYIDTEALAEYMILPRMSALAATGWNQKEQKDWEQFRNKLPKLLERYDQLGIHYAKSAYIPEIKIEWNDELASATASLSTELPATIHFTLDGTTPTIDNAIANDSLIQLGQAKEITAQAFVDGKAVGPELKKASLTNLAMGKSVDLKSKTYGRYKAKGAQSLTDLKVGGETWGSAEWLGFLNTDLLAIVDLDKAQNISAVHLRCIEQHSSGISFPTQIVVEGSNDQVNFQTIGSIDIKESGNDSGQISTEIFKIASQKNTNYRYIKIRAKCKRSKTQGWFIFTDEIMIY
ncbi:family 20 glycosylhydrolase [Persicobacter diffluens]